MSTDNGITTSILSQPVYGKSIVQINIFKDNSAVDWTLELVDNKKESTFYEERYLTDVEALQDALKIIKTTG
ncbi:MAG: hypothetical protein HRU15_03305 [Planctomycetes bacterium]|nr:hypothetical protein [Planctomycetota bacterium]